MTGQMAQVGGWEFDPHSGKGTWTDEVARIHDLDPAQETNMALGMSFYSGAARQAIEKAVRDAVELGIAYDLELEITSAKGLRKWVRTIGLPVKESGKVVKVRGIFQDITVRKQAEGALKENEERFRSLYENSTLGLYRTTPGGKILLANPTLVSMLGYDSFDELSKRNLEEDGFEPSYTRAKFIEAIETQGKLHGEESLWTRKDGVQIYVRESARCVRDAQGNTLYYDGTVEDITVHKKEEEKLVAAEARYRRLFEAAKDGILILDAETGIMVDVNPFLVEMLGFPREEILGKSIWELGFFRDIVASKANFLELQSKEYIRYEDLPLRTADGRSIEVEFTSNVYEVNHKKVFQCNIRNITERKRVETENTQLREKAEISSRLAAVGEMAAGIAHEINNPLTGVIGFSELLLEANLPPEIKEQVKIIADGSHRVKDIVRRVLTFARQNKLAKTSANVNELIDNTIEIRSYVLRTANIEVVRNYDPSLPWVTADPGQLQQVFLNLIVNAEFAMKKAHDKGSLTITTENKDVHIRISFRDDGPGMSQEIIKKIFNPFFTTKDPGEGTGLGLSLSRSIILEHNGTIEVESEPGKGANFIITLPVTPTTKEAISETAADISAPPEKVRAAHVLVVDDEDAIRKLVSTILAKNGHTVETTGNAEEALSKLDSKSYDAVLMDIRMPGMSGPELYNNIIVKHPKLSSKCIFLTGDTSDSNTRDFLEQNGLPYITKPFDRETLTQRVNDIL
jgi:PAS domain S-box-containing protein